MLKNYFKIALRNLIKYKKYSLINILGLAIGLASVILILLWVQDELSYDKFHTHSKQIYLSVRSELGDPSVSTSMQLGPTLTAEIPEVLNATAYVTLPAAYQCFLQHGEKGFNELLGLVDPQFFNIFSYEFLSGDIQSSLTDLNSLIITEQIAQKYFGNSDVVGKSLQFSMFGKTSVLNITGVLKNLPKNTHIKREVFLNRRFLTEFIKQFGVSNWDHWENRPARTYIQVQPNTDISQLDRKSVV